MHAVLFTIGLQALLLFGGSFLGATSSLGAFLQSNWKVFNHGTLKNHIQWVRWRASRSLPIGDKMAYPRRRITFSVQLGVPLKHRHMQKVPNWCAWKILSVPAPDHTKSGVFWKKSYKILLNFSCFLCFEDHNFFWPKFAKVKPICFAPAYILETSDTILQLLLQNSGSHINAGVKEKWQKWCIFTPKKSGSKTLLVIL